jgi:hypothetical protein
MQRFLIFVSVIGLIAEANAQTLTIERRSDQIFQLIVEDLAAMKTMEIN